MLFSISDKFGHIRSDFTDEELAQLTDPQREALAKVISAARKAEVAEQDEVAAAAAPVEASKALTEAEKKLRDSMPKVDHIDEVRRISENGRRAALGLGPLPPVKHKPPKQLVTAAAEAET